MARSYGLYSIAKTAVSIAAGVILWCGMAATPALAQTPCLTPNAPGCVTESFIVPPNSSAWQIAPGAKSVWTTSATCYYENSNGSSTWYSDSITMKITNLPKGVTVTISPNPFNISLESTGNATVTFTAAPDAPIGLPVSLLSVNSVGHDCWYPSSSAPLQVALCGDERDQLIAEYIKYHNTFVPGCSNFTKSASGPTYTFAMLNSSYNYATSKPYSYILLNVVLVQDAHAGPGLDRWLHFLEVSPNYKWHNINSGYRNPAKQHAVNPAVVESQHVYGDAIDLQNISQTQPEYDALKGAAKQAGASWIEAFSGPQAPCSKYCVHADWRSYPKTFAP